MGDTMDEDKGKETPHGETPPSISPSPSISQEEHLESLDTFQASMRLEMKAMFEEYLGKKSPKPTDPNTTPCVDLSLAKVKPPNNGSTSAENKGAPPKENDGPAKGAFIPPQTLIPLRRSIILCHTLTTWDLLLSLILAILLNGKD
jgi:hypothetical protein